MRKILLPLLGGLIVLGLRAEVRKNNNIVNKAIAFNFDNVIARYQKDYNVSDRVAAEHARELKRYLSLCSIYPDCNFHMFSEEVDNLWHTFIIYTREYARFCKEVAGKYLHHVPLDNKVKNLNNNRAEKIKFIEKYTAIFKEKPPSHIWSKGGDCSDCFSIISCGNTCCNVGGCSTCNTVV